ncbi:TRAP transporter small permease [Pseudooceanicola sp. CBS1P-1]|uniref:TRAP transporter small permease protein n=1 Tax=Pseudooceanicola albus TaxID=2692189 RepID=A0A6L7G6M9_9RHOB|nr:MULTISPECIES: TRAP transporter small permease [Pseudooceanicola]MBT9386835.1 TRAP transporter small permease [Pseudooceanicola endophyticus]MXN19342.1 TRAP transporter small permease subunit [Pseudooceanicola albus]
MQTLFSVLGFVDRLVARVTRYGVILCMVVLFSLLLLRVIARTLEIPFAAYDEIVELSTIWMILLGTVALWREGALYRVEVITDKLPALARPAEVLIQGIMLAFAIMLVQVGSSFTAMSREVTAFMQIDMVIYYGAIPAAGAVMAVYSLLGLAGAILIAVKARSGEALAKSRADRAVPEHL